MGPRLYTVGDTRGRTMSTPLMKCLKCNHPWHAGKKCLQALRFGKPGQDTFCLCDASTTRVRTWENMQPASDYFKGE